MIKRVSDQNKKLGGLKGFWRVKKVRVRELRKKQKGGNNYNKKLISLPNVLDLLMRIYVDIYTQ